MPAYPPEPVDAVVGIDLAVQLGKRLPVCALVADATGNRFIPLRTAKAKPPQGPGNAALIGSVRTARDFAKVTVEYLRNIEEEFFMNICRVVIDAPWDHAEENGIRPAERRLDEMRIPYYRTPSKQAFDRIREGRLIPGDLGGANQIWMLAGFELFKAIVAAQIECIETYPFAVWWAYGAERYGKKTPEGFKARVKAIEAMAKASSDAFTPAAMRRLCYGSMHDVVDAMMCARRWDPGTGSQNRHWT